MRECNRKLLFLQSGPCRKVLSVSKDSPHPWSVHLEIKRDGPVKPAVKAERDHHLMFAANGMNSILCKTYGGRVIT